MKLRPSHKPLAALFGVILALAIAEGLATVYIKIVLPISNPALGRDFEIIDRNETRWAPHPYMNYVPQAGYKVVSRRGEVISQHNSLGFRGPEFSQAKSAGTFRIVLLGGSAAYSSRVPEDAQMITTRLQETLVFLGFKNVEVINAGVSAYSTAEALAMLQFRVLELSPDLVIVYEAINDLHNRYVPPELFHADNRGRLRAWSGQYFPWWSKTSIGRVIGYRAGWLKQNLFLDYYIAAPTYEGHTAEDKKIDGAELLKKNDTRFFRENLLSMLAICRIRGIDMMVASYASTPERNELGYLSTKDYAEGLKEMNEALRDFAVKNSVKFYDYAAAMPKDAKYWRDEVHVSPDGAKLTGELFARFLKDQRMIKK